MSLVHALRIFQSRCKFSTLVVVVVFTLKTVLTSIQYPSLSYSSRQRNEFPWSQAITQNKVQKNNEKNKDPEKVPTLATKI